MTGQTLAEVLCGGSNPCDGHTSTARWIEAHLAAILADPETVEAVAQGMAMAVVTPRGRRQARAAIAVIAERLGLA